MKTSGLFLKTGLRRHVEIIRKYFKIKPLELHHHVQGDFPYTALHNSVLIAADAVLRYIVRKGVLSTYCIHVAVFPAFPLYYHYCYKFLKSAGFSGSEKLISSFLSHNSSV